MQPMLTAVVPGQLQHQFALAVEHVHGAQPDLVGQPASTGRFGQHDGTQAGARQHLAQAAPEHDVVVRADRVQARPGVQRVADVRTVDLVQEARAIAHVFRECRMGVEQMQPARRLARVQRGAHADLGVLAGGLEPRQLRRHGRAQRDGGDGRRDQALGPAMFFTIEFHAGRPATAKRECGR
jgi:hypothetical protein